QPEHTQIDIEMSFPNEEDVLALVEGLMSTVFRKVAGVEIPTPFPRLTFREAISRYGSDKPDLRFGVEIAEVTDLLRESEYGVFRNAAAQPGGVVAAIAAPPGHEWSRKVFGELEELARRHGAGGLAWTRVADAGFDGGVGKYLDGAAGAEIRK